MEQVNIYKISNKLNGKAYVGKTHLSIEERFKEHVKDSKKRRCENRPLYRAFNKYGIHNFKLELIDTVPLEDENKAEIHYIKYFDTYNNGYNATIGGDGKTYIDRQKIVDLWDKGLTITRIAETLGIDRQYTSKLLKRNSNVDSKDIKKRAIKKESKAVMQLDKAGNLIKIHPSITKAMQSLGKERNDGKISLVCRGKRKTAYGFKWQFLNA